MRRTPCERVCLGICIPSMYKYYVTYIKYIYIRYILGIPTYRYPIGYIYYYISKEYKINAYVHCIFNIQGIFMCIYCIRILYLYRCYYFRIFLIVQFSVTVTFD